MSMTNWDSHCALAESSTNTEMKIDKAIYVWKINNFNYYEEIGIDIDSPIFSASTNPKVKWSIKLSPKNECKPKLAGPKQEYIGLHLILSNESKEKEVFAKYLFSIFNEDEEIFYSETCKAFRKFDDEGDSWGWERFCVKDARFRESVLPNNILRIYCEVIFPKNKGISEHHHFCHGLFLQSAVAKHESTNICDSLMKTHLMSDVVISVKTKEFLAHKAILATRSKVFAAMFQHNMKESQENRIEIKDVSEEAFKEMLHFIYIGKCTEKLDDLAMELYFAADKYELHLLKIFCLQSFFKNLTVENIIENLLFADKYGESELKSEVIKFIVAYATEVFDTEEWKIILNDPRLSQEVFGAMARQED